jgi:hypothetical protein
VTFVTRHGSLTVAGTGVVVAGTVLVAGTVVLVSTGTAGDVSTVGVVTASGTTTTGAGRRLARNHPAAPASIATATNVTTNAQIGAGRPFG